MLRILPTILTLAVLFAMDTFGSNWPIELKLGLLLPIGSWNTAILVGDLHRRQDVTSIR